LFTERYSLFIFFPPNDYFLSPNPIKGKNSMKGKSALKEKSFVFGLSIIEIYRKLKESKKEYILYRQLLRSGTAIGALVREAEYAQSKADFINKLSIALKEANETEYWLELLFASDCLEKEIHRKDIDLLKELIRMLVASINTLKKVNRE
jgi:four helix bundle protein